MKELRSLGRPANVIANQLEELWKTNKTDQEWEHLKESPLTMGHLEMVVPAAFLAALGSGWITRGEYENTAFSLRESLIDLLKTHTILPSDC